MINIDWSYAPPGAEHFHKGDILYRPHWRKSGFYCDLGLEAFGWIKDTYPSPINECIERPQPKPWSGPEDGLPPVSTICEYRLEPSNQWHECEILYHIKHAHDEDPRAVVWNEHLGFDQVSGSNWRFRPILTPDQVAADKRETAIREIMDVADVDCRVTAARLVDAGFKREVL